MAGGEWGACGGYHAMRHVRVTSRGRSREHRVLPITCPVTRSPFHPSLSDLSDSVSLSLSLSLFLLTAVTSSAVGFSFLESRRGYSTPFEHVYARIYELALARTDYVPTYLFHSFYFSRLFRDDTAIVSWFWTSDCIFFCDLFFDVGSLSNQAKANCYVDRKMTLSKLTMFFSRTFLKNSELK